MLFFSDFSYPDRHSNITVSLTQCLVPASSRGSFHSEFPGSDHLGGGDSGGDHHYRLLLVPLLVQGTPHAQVRRDNWSWGHAIV